MNDDFKVWVIDPMKLQVEWLVSALMRIDKLQESVEYMNGLMLALATQEI